MRCFFWTKFELKCGVYMKNLLHKYIFFEIFFFYFQILAIFSYGLQRWFDNIYIMAGSKMYGLTKLYMAFLPVPILPILYSYFNYGPFHPSNNGLADLHVYGLTTLLASIVIDFSLFNYNYIL